MANYYDNLSKEDKALVKAIDWFSKNFGRKATEIVLTTLRMSEAEAPEYCKKEFAKIGCGEWAAYNAYNAWTGILNHYNK